MLNACLTPTITHEYSKISTPSLAQTQSYEFSQRSTSFSGRDGRDAKFHAQIYSLPGPALA